jgi:hypothetical protein
MAAYTVLSLWLPARDTDEDAIEAGAIPDLFRVRIPRGETTQFQKDVTRLADSNIREVHLQINKRKPYSKNLSFLNSLSKEVSTMYNDWSEQDADVEEEEEEDEEDDDEEEDEEEEDEDEEETEEGEIKPPAKRPRVEPPPYEIPIVLSLKSQARSVLAPHLNVSREDGEPTSVRPYAEGVNEHFVTVFVTQEDED